MISSSRKIRRSLFLDGWTPILFIGLLLSLPATALAVEGAKVCSPILDVDPILTGLVFDGDTVRVNVEIGNSQITGGDRMEIDGFGYALDCQKGQNFASCESAGHLISYSGGITSDCPTGSGVVELAPQETSIAITTKKDKPVVLDSGETCNVQFDVLIEEFNRTEDTGPWLRQSAGWPVTVNEITYGAVCYDGDTSFGGTAQSSSTGIPVQKCGIEVDKQVSVDGGVTWFSANDAGSAAEQTIDGTAIYQAVVTNTGTVGYVGDILINDPVLGLSNVSVAGPGAGAIIEIPLTPTEAAEFNGVCNVVGQVVNEVTVDASCRTGDSPVTTTFSNEAYLECIGNPSIVIDKKTGPSVEGPFTDGPTILAGGSVYWQYTVKNDGDLPLTNVGVTDDMVDEVSCPQSTLAVNEEITCTASGTAVSGAYVNTGAAVGVYNSNGDFVDASDVSNYFGAAPAILIVKAANPMTFDSALDPISYTFLVTNTGNVTLTGVVVNDPLLSGVTCGPWPNDNPAGTLLAGESVPCAGDAAYETTQDDVDTGYVDNEATTTGSPPVGPNVSSTDDERVTASQTPAIKIVKTASPTTYTNPYVDGEVPTGDEITYTFVVSNTGNVTLSNVTVTDSLLNSLDPAITVSCTGWNTDEKVLLPGESVDCTASDTYKITEADIVAESVVNTATVTGQPKVGDPVTDDDSKTVTLAGLPAIEIVKTVEPTTFSALEDVLVYTFVVTNTGDVVLDFDEDGYVEDVLLDINNDPLTPIVAGGIVCDEDANPSPNGALNVGDSITCTGSYTVTQADLDRGFVENEAETNATGNGEPVTDSDTAIANSTAVPTIELLKEISVDGGVTFTDANDPANAPTQLWPADAEYRITVTNTGPLTLTGIVLNDAELSIVNESLAQLAPGASHVLTKVEIAALAVPARCGNSGTFTNTADVAATTLTEVPVPVNDSDKAVLVCIGEPGISILKEVRSGPEGEWSSVSEPYDAAPPVEAPSDAEYRITVKNTGNTDLTDVVVTDDDLTPAIAYTIGDLAKGETVVLYWAEACGGPNDDPLALCDLYVTNRCEQAGELLNTASVEGWSVEVGGGVAAAAAAVLADEGKVSDSDTAKLVCVGQPLIDLQKEISLDGIEWFDADDAANALITQLPEVGGVDVEYRFIVSNIGPVDLQNVWITDGQLKLTNNPGDYGAIEVGELAAGASFTVDKGIVEELEVPERCGNAGTFANTASVSGFSIETGAKAEDGDAAYLVCTGTEEILLDKKVGVCVADDDSSDDDSSSGGSCSKHGSNGKDGSAGLMCFDDDSSEEPEAECYLAGNDDDDSSSGGKTCAETGSCGTKSAKPSLETWGWGDDDSSSGDKRIPGVIKYFDVTPGMQPPQDAWYKITVTNVGTSDLEDVVVNDQDLFIFDYSLGDLGVGEEVVIDKDHPDLGDSMFWPERCTSKGEYMNLATTDGFSVDPPYNPVTSSDTATLVCEDVDICLHGKPKVLKVEYDGDPDTWHNQSSSSVYIHPENPLFPAGKVNIKVTDQWGRLVRYFFAVDIGDEMRISGYRYRKASKLKFEIFENWCSKDDDSSSGKKKSDDGDGGGQGIETWNWGDDDSSDDKCKPKAPIQKIIFSVDCDQPLNIGNEFGAITIVD
ncbi:MAG: hypothetical protein V2I48_15205 [Xanthomonadales bacterium]|nr:hypothetical protein [Xanthomonadales bacterium]